MAAPRVPTYTLEGDQTMNLLRRLLTLTLLLLTTQIAFAQITVNVRVPGYANPWLAGMPNGTVAWAGDSAPSESPIQVPGIPVNPGDIVTFAATGSVDAGGGIPHDPPDGDALRVGTHQAGPEFDNSNIIAPMNSLLGVFLGPFQPNQLPRPTSLDFSTRDDRDYGSIAPDAQQVFFIGSGVTQSGTLRQVVVPDGATRLLLGTMDEWGWRGNTGSFAVEVTESQGSPQDTGFFIRLVGLRRLADGKYSADLRFNNFSNDNIPVLQVDDVGLGAEVSPLTPLPVDFSLPNHTTNTVTFTFASTAGPPGANVDLALDGAMYDQFGNTLSFFFWTFTGLKLP